MSSVISLGEARREYPEALAAIEARISEWRGELSDPPATDIEDVSIQDFEGVLSLIVRVRADFLTDDGSPLCVAFARPVFAGHSVH